MKLWHMAGWGFLGLALLFSFYLEFIVVPATKESSHWWSAIPGFYGIFGFIGIILLVLITKLSGKLFLERKEDYYDGN